MYHYLLHNVLLNSTLYEKRSSNYIAWNMINGKLIWGYVLYIKKSLLQFEHFVFSLKWPKRCILQNVVIAFGSKFNDYSD